MNVDGMPVIGAGSSRDTSGSVWAKPNAVTLGASRHYRARRRVFIMSSVTDGTTNLVPLVLTVNDRSLVHGHGAR